MLFRLMLVATLALTCRIDDRRPLEEDFGVCAEAPAPGEVPAEAIEQSALLHVGIAVVRPLGD